MSTYMYLVCREHDAVAEEESGQHRYDLPRIRADITMREENLRTLSYLSIMTIRDFFGYFTERSVLFFAEHPDCKDFGIVTEYGENVPTAEDIERDRALDAKEHDIRMETD